MENTTEIVLFHVHDPAPALNFGDVPNELLFDICVRSIRAKSPSSAITLLTDDATTLGANYPDVEIIRSAVNTDFIMYERSRLYAEHVARRTREGSARNMAFLDIDIIVNRDIAGVFTEAFDVGLTFRIEPGLRLDERGIPLNTAASPINGGVIFARPTAAASAFFTEQMRVYDALHKEGNFAVTLAKDIRKWGGDQFALMAIAGKALLVEAKSTAAIASAQVRFLPCDLYNFTPEDGAEITPALLAPCFIIHMKGPRKKAMPALAQWMGI